MPSLNGTRFNAFPRLKGLLLALSLTVAVAGTFSGCASNGVPGPSASALEAKVATVDGKAIPKASYDAMMSEITKLSHLPPQLMSNPMFAETLKRQVLNTLILNTLIENDAQKMGIQVSDAEFQKMKEDQIKQAGGRPVLDQYLRQSQISESEFDEHLRHQMLMNKFVEAKAGNSLKISDQQAQEYYKSHPTEFDIPETVDASHILIKAIVPEMKREIRTKNPKISDADLDKQIAAQKSELKAKADAIYRQVQADPSKFAELAKKDSQDPLSAIKGGELGPLSQKSLDPVFWGAIVKTKPGTLYPGVLETQFGYHVIMVKDHAQAHHQTFNDAKAAIIHRLEDEKKQHVMETWVNDKKSHAKIVIEDAYKPKDMTPAGAPKGMMAPPAANGKSAPAPTAIGSPAPAQSAAAPQAPAAASSAPAPGQQPAVH